jgi:hypothetical protein
LGGGNSGSPAVTLPARPGTGRPSPGDVGDFLGINRPVTLPAVIDKRPGGGNPPVTTLPGRPGGGNPPVTTLPARPGDGNRPNWPKPGDINIGNTVINNRPTWVNINNTQIINIQNNWSHQINNLHNWPTRYPNRMAGWRRWGDDVRGRWRYYGHQRNWFTANWWASHRFAFGGWNYFYRFNRFPWRYWWSIPTFASLVNWFTWTAPPVVWAQPVYYDYGTGGNVVYNNNNVYINGQQVATADQFAQSAMALATVPPPASEEKVEAAEWLPLGTFAVSSEKKDVDPSRVLQLAVTKEGIISGTLYNAETDQTQAVQGQVDKETQRVAFRIGESDNIVVETGLYNLTQDEAPALVHFGTEKVEDWLLVRLEAPEDSEDAKKE